MRLCLLALGCLFTTACGLSMNPDLPSTEESDREPFDPPQPDLPDGGDIDLGEGNTPPALGSGGSGVSTCTGLGGEGGASSCGGAL